MVPSRSRKTAGRRALLSGRVHLQRRNPEARGGFYGFGSNASHTTVIRRAAAQKTRAAIGFFLNDAATRRDGCGAQWVRWAEDGHDGKADSRGDVHRSGVVANEEMTPGKKSRQIV